MRNDKRKIDPERVDLTGEHKLTDGDQAVLAVLLARFGQDYDQYMREVPM